MYQAINSDLNPCPANAISESVDPVAVLLGLLNTHRAIVAPRLQTSMEVMTDDLLEAVLASDIDRHAYLFHDWCRHRVSG